MTGRGAFVVFEGGEGSGKSTQASRLAERRSAVLTRQPGGTEIGSQIRQLLLSGDTAGLSLRAEALLMAADRAQHVDQLINPALNEGQDVICDRYLGSSLAYQGAGRELGVEQVRDLSTFAVDGVMPDLVLLLDVPVAVSRERIGADRDRLERLPDDFHQRVRDAYLALAAAEPEVWVVIDGTASVVEISSQIDAVVAERFGW